MAPEADPFERVGADAPTGEANPSDFSYDAYEARGFSTGLLRRRQP